MLLMNCMLVDYVYLKVEVVFIMVWLLMMMKIC